MFVTEKQFLFSNSSAMRSSKSYNFGTADQWADDDDDDSSSEFDDENFVEG